MNPFFWSKPKGSPLLLAHKSGWGYASGAAAVTFTSVAGDLLLAVTQATSPATPSGWTRLTINSTAGVWWFWKKAVGNEGSVNFNSNNVYYGIVSVNQPWTNMTGLDSAYVSTSGDPTAREFDASGATGPTVCIGVVESTSIATAAPSGTLVANGAIRYTATSRRVYQEIRNDSPALRTLDCNDGGTTNRIFGFVAQLNK